MKNMITLLAVMVFGLSSLSAQTKSESESTQYPMFTVRTLNDYFRTKEKKETTINLYREALMGHYKDSHMQHFSYNLFGEAKAISYVANNATTVSTTDMLESSRRERTIKPRKREISLFVDPEFSASTSIVAQPNYQLYTGLSIRMIDRK